MMGMLPLPFVVFSHFNVMKVCLQEKSNITCTCPTSKKKGLKGKRGGWEDGVLKVFKGRHKAKLVF